MASDPRRRDSFMHICAHPENQSKCQEEIRIEDYLKAYTTTGRPPLSVTQEPAGVQARAALGLPPLFEPYVEPFSSDSASTAITPAASMAQTTDQTKLPRIQTFQPVIDGDTYQSISAVPEYSFFSHEELRYCAYASGVITPPVPLPLDPPPITLSSSGSSRPPEALITPDMHPFFAKDTKSNAFFDEPNTVGQGSLYYHSISASRRYNGHSFEELRIAFLTAGRELDSSEISSAPVIAATPGISPAPSTNTAFGSLFGSSATGGAFAQSPAVRPF